jgi:hypothetical protein
MAHLLAAALLLAAAPDVDPRLVGDWALDGEPFMVLNADGTGLMDAGRVRWTASGGILTVTALDGSADRVRYRVSGNVLTLEQAAGTARLTRGAASAEPRGGAAAGDGGAQGPAQGTAARAAPVPPPAAAPGSAASARDAPPGASGRAIRFNGRALDGPQRETLGRVERAIGTIPDGDYWYDPRTGASGRWGGPALAFLVAGLDLGGPLPAEASGGGRGTLTGVFVNGRELHPVDVAGLQQIIGAVTPGRWWVDAAGNYGPEGGLAVGNLVALAQARRGGGSGGRAWSRHYEGVTPRDNLNMASDGTTTCVSVSGYSRCTGE